MVPTMKRHSAKMACEGCEKTVRKAVASVDPDAVLDVDLATRHIEIRTVTEAEPFEAALAAVGYPASPAKA